MEVWEYEKLIISLAKELQNYKTMYKEESLKSIELEDKIKEIDDSTQHLESKVRQLEGNVQTLIEEVARLQKAPAL